VAAAAAWKPGRGSHGEASFRLDPSRPARSARSPWGRGARPGAGTTPSLTGITGIAGSATCPLSRAGLGVDDVAYAHAQEATVLVRPEDGLGPQGALGPERRLRRR